MHLDLRAPLEYAHAPGLDPFGPEAVAGEESQEWAFCFEVDKAQAGRIDPQPDSFLGELVFSGKGQGDGDGQLAGPDWTIPAGLYLFDQQRKALDRQECVALAIEQQKDGLWERHRLESRLYIRRLYEDGSAVTQVFRPCSGGA